MFSSSSSSSASVLRPPLPSSPSSSPSSSPTPNHPPRSSDGRGMRDTMRGEGSRGSQNEGGRIRWTGGLTR
eukprot:2396017-Pyramimonas_sp.AAC.1